MALLRSHRISPHVVRLLEERDSAAAVLEELAEVSCGPSAGADCREPRLFKDDAPNIHILLDDAARDIAGWEAEGIGMLSLLDPGYPTNLRMVHDRPPLLFVAGELQTGDARSVAVIGSRQASTHAVATASRIAEHLVDCGYTVVSGLAAGIDSTAHRSTLVRRARTVAVIGTGLNRCYPPENQSLQRQIAREGAVVSRFWPEDPPTRRSFPMRNAVMSGIALATVVVAAGPTSGARIQARLALAHGRPVFLLEPVLAQRWARELATRPATYVFRSPGEITGALERLTFGALVA